MKKLLTSVLAVLVLASAPAKAQTQAPELLHSFGTTTAQGLFSTYMSLAELGDLFAHKAYDSAKVTQVATGFKNMTATAKTSLTTLAASGKLDAADTEFAKQAAEANGLLGDLAQSLISVAADSSAENRAAFEESRQKSWKLISKILGIEG